MTRFLGFTDVEAKIAKRTSVALDVIACRPKKRRATVARIHQTLCAGIMAIAGCGSPPSSTPTAGGAPIPWAAERMSTVKSPMSTETSSQDLLYVSSEDRGVVYVYSYPQGQLLETLTNLEGAAGECSDSTGNVFITTVSQSGSGTIYEYAHGGTTPIQTLTDPGSPNGCSVDPKSGDLAVSNPRDASNPYYPYQGDLAIYTQAQGPPKMYYIHNPAIGGFAFCGYDDKANLYLTTGVESSSGPELVRFAGGKFHSISLGVKLYGDLSGLSIQWDGRHMAVSSSLDHEPMLIYRLRMLDTSAKVVGTTRLSSNKNIYTGQIWIQNGTVIGVGAYKRGYQNAFFWPYPSGGRHIGGITKVGDIKQILWGVTVSIVPHP